MAAPAANCNADAADAATAGSKRSFPGGDAAHSDRRVQPRHLHAGPSPATAAAAASSGGDGAASSEPNPPPPAAAARLHRHALESIFAFLDHDEAVMALQVSRQWLAAVKSMASLELCFDQPSRSVPLCVVADSAIGRHVTQLGVDENYMQMNADSLFIAARHMAQLVELRCDLTLPEIAGPLSFPRGLQRLYLRVAEAPAAADVNAVVAAIRRLPLLESLTVHLPAIDGELSFAPLARIRHLADLSVRRPTGGADLSDAQVTQLRALPQLRRLDVHPMPTSLLRRLLAQPHELQWQQIGPLSPLSDEVAALLPQLPTLTEFGNVISGVPLRATCERFDFLRRLPNLTHVSLAIPESSVAGRIESLVGGLQCCSQIQTLALHSADLTAAHLADLLPRLPLLRTLSLGSSDIETLSFLAHPPMTAQLSALTLSECRQLPLTELRHVHALKGLKKLRLARSFDVPMDPLSQSLFTPPSLLMPQLEEFDYDQ